MPDPGTLTFEWNGRPVAARPGDSVAAALTAAGERVFGASRTGRARGLFCGMGACQDCLVRVDGARSQRACMTEVRDGMQVAAQDDLAPADHADPSPARPASDVPVDLAVIGAGPAGLNAALVARAGGLSVLVLDERGETGGQYFKPRSDGYRGGTAPDDQHLRGTDLRQRARSSGAGIRCAQTIWFARAVPEGFDLRGIGPGGQTPIRARAVILATGAMERPALVPGWTLPGVMTIGAAQTLVRRYGALPGKRVLIAGHGPLGLQLAAEMLGIGGQVAALAERGSPGPGAALLRAAIAAPGLVRDGLAYRLCLARARVPVLAGWEVTAIRGETTAESAVLRRLSDGAKREVAADAVCIGDGFAPQMELARLLGVPVDLDPATGAAVPRRDEDGRTPVPGLWIAGDAGGLGGAHLAEAQGRLAAAGVLRHLGRAAPDDPASRRAAASARRFQAALWTLYAAPPRDGPQGDTPICRCEGVTAAQVQGAIDSGATDSGAVKRATRLGMGRCQGRYCLPAALRMLRAAGHPATAEAMFAPQIPARPVPVAALALEKPEWGGHVESSPGARPGGASGAPLTTTQADLVIVGAGITGIAAALQAARDGASVICLDRGAVNGEASGGNAGSLHLQLLSWDFGGKAVAGGSPQLLTLPLQQQSIALWSQLEAELGADFEMQVTGGLMVAEDAAQIAFLEDKARAEAKVGIATEVIGPDRIRQLVPGISDRIVAAAWCAGEGKINPLAATPALAAAARAAGARIAERTPVTGIVRDGDGYAVATPRGTVRAGRVLIASGGWSAGIARMLGTDLPIRGAPLQMVVTDPAPPLMSCLIAHADRHLTMKQTAAGTILIGGAWTATTGPDGQPLVLPQSLEGNLWVAAHTVPAIGALSVVRSWAAMNIDIDGAPLIGPVPGHPGVTVAATANGYTLGPLIGQAAARIALSGKVPPELAPFTIDRFS